ncbi:MAG: anthranilate phosphoribosyltransferase [Candidatus Moranbacteria bacterium]|nr:anthranilate phosphoribosyltransferase [Candidatus Moranbacteria bacterium]
MQKKIINGKLSKKQIIGIFQKYEKIGITDQELLGIVKATKEKMKKVEVEFDCLDTCGTGGDKLNTFNISTVSAIVSCACGVPVAKHGNRAASSKCGSADVLEALGIKLVLNSSQAKKCLEKVGFVFMFAPIFHPALIHVKEARIEYGKITYFNLLGPMLNPANAKYQVIGVTYPNKIDLMKNVLLKTGSKRIMFVHGKNGMDEISVSGESAIMQISQNSWKVWGITPKKMKLKSYPISQIKGGDSKQNAKIVMDILNNQATEAQLNVVLLNTAAGLVVFGKARDFNHGVELAKKIIKSKKALKKLQSIIRISNNV